MYFEDEKLICSEKTATFIERLNELDFKESKFIIECFSRLVRSSSNQNQTSEYRNFANDVIAKYSGLAPKEFYDKRIAFLRELSELDKLDILAISASKTRNAKNLSNHSSLEAARELLERSVGVKQIWPNSLEALEKAWQKLSKENPLAEYRRVNDDGSCVLDRLRDSISLGDYPPPEYLILIVYAYEKYLNAEGDLSLDEALFGEPHSKRGSYAYKIRGNDFDTFHALYTYKMEQLPGIEDTFASIKELRSSGLVDAATIFLEQILQDFELDVESFLRGYRRWKADNGHV